MHYLAATGSGIKTLRQYFILFNAAVLSVRGQICPALFWTIISHPGCALQDLAYLSFSQRLLQLGRNAEGTLLNSNTLKEHKLIGRKSENLFTRTQPFSSLARLSPFQCWTLYNPHFDVIWSQCVLICIYNSSCIHQAPPAVSPLGSSEGKTILQELREFWCCCCETPAPVIIFTGRKHETTAFH